MLKTLRNIRRFSSSKEIPLDRTYFYEMDTRGLLFLQEAGTKSIATALRDQKFLV